MKKSVDATTASATGLLAGLSAQLNAITPDQFIEPEDKPQEDDHIVSADIPDYVKCSFTLCSLLGNDLRLAMRQVVWDAMKNLEGALATGDPEQQKKLIEESDPEKFARAHRVLNEKFGIAERAFWSDLRSAVPELADKRRIGIRAGWKVCWKEDASPGVSDFLKENMGDSDNLGELLGAILGGGRHGVQIVRVERGGLPSRRRRLFGW